MIVRNSMLALFAVTVSVFSSGCPLVEVEVYAQAVCVTIDGIDFDGAADAGPEGELVAIETTVDASDDIRSIREALLAANLSGTFELQSAVARIAPGAGPSSFDFVEAIELVARAPSTDPTTSLPLGCEACGTSEAELDLGIAPVDISSYMQAGELVLDLAVVGQPPRESWSMDIELCIAGTVSYKKEL